MTLMDLPTLFSESGPLARAFDGYCVRHEQIEMSQAVQAAIRDGRTVVLEAGTGVGKTAAYLVPALLEGGKVVVSTGTKALQDQLFHRDLPAVRDALAVPVKVALLKGRSNYLCWHHLERANQDATLLGSKQEVRDLATAIKAQPALALTGIEGYEGVIHGEHAITGIRDFAASLVRLARVVDMGRQPGQHLRFVILFLHYRPPFRAFARGRLTLLVAGIASELSPLSAAIELDCSRMR